MSKENIFAGWDAPTVKRFKQWQMRTILVSMIGYAIYYFVRKNFSVAMPGLTAQYGITNTSFGIIIGIGSLIYGFSRFINGFVVDRASSRLVMAVGLLLCAATNFCFGFGVNISGMIVGGYEGPDFVNMLILVMGVTSILNQYFQGIGYPPCARLLPSWIHPSELATKMSIWNTSHSIGAGAAVLACGFIMGQMGQDLSGNPEIIDTIARNLKLDPSNADNLKTIMGYASHWDAWRWCFWLPGCLAVVGAIWLYVGLRDDPRSVGLPELPGTNTGKKTGKDGKKSASHSKFLKAMVWTNRWIWTLCIANVFVYVMRMGILDWGPKFLTEARGMSIEMAATSVAIFEICAIVGTIIAGWSTDHIFKGKAHRMCLICMVGAVLFMSLFIFITGIPTGFSIALLAMAGFFIYGPQALIGIASANHATKDASATANGLAGIFGYVGSFLSAIGIGFIADHYGWNTVFFLIIGVGVLGAITFLTMWAAPRDGYARSNAFYAKQQEEEAMAEAGDLNDTDL
ncbi:MAG: MFS transporter [Firmicutes bacterium]|nr:MFS transporter [Bacillota bacterium]MCM1401488.1 MFS transporter [Bacteroides sp.]MCM1477423.1 MFS transporter [Bacteroides sp.]